MVYSVCPDGRMVEKPVLEAYRTQFNGNLVNVGKNNLRMSMTPDHRVVYRKFGSNINEIIPWNQHTGKSISIVRSPESYSAGGYCGETLGLDVYSYLAFIGIYLAEGCVNQTPRNGNYKIVVTQSKARSMELVKDLLDKLPWKFCYSKNGDFQACNKLLREYLLQFGKAHQKYIPREILKTATDEQLRTLLGWMTVGDGTIRNKSISYFTSSKQLADDVLEIGVKLGYKATVKTHFFSNPNHNTRYIIYLTREGSVLTKIDKGFSRNDVAQESYSGPVYCIKVADNENFVLRQSGTVWVSGNTNPGGKFGDWVKEDFIPDEYLALSKEPDKQFGRVWEKRTDCAECNGSGIMDLASCIYCEGYGYRTRYFVPSRIQDNPSIDMAEYLRSLINLPPVERYRLEKGDWTVSELGDLFKPEWVRYYHRRGDHFILTRPDQTDIIVPINELTTFVTADTASKEKTTADFTCISSWGYHQRSGSLILIHSLMTRMEVPKIADAILAQSSACRAEFVMIEDAQCGIGVIQELRGPKGKGIAIQNYSPNGIDKIARSTTAQVKMAAGQIFFPSGQPGWLVEPYAQLLGFPQATHDDFVDTVSMAASWVQSRHYISCGSTPGILEPVGRYLSFDTVHGITTYRAR